MTLYVRLYVALRGATLGLMLVSACGGILGSHDAPDGEHGAAGGASGAGGDETGGGGGTLGAGGQHATGPTVETVVGPWMLSELKEGGELVPLLPEYSYNWTPAHSEVELNYLVLGMSARVDSLSSNGQFYRWSIESEMAVDGLGGCAFSSVTISEYPPFHLLEPLAADFCPDACFAARDAFERVVLSVDHCEISNGVLTLANKDRSNSLVLLASDYDLTGLLN